MEAFTTHTGRAVPLDRADVDTDQIIPKQFLKRVERAGYGQFLFWDWRMTADGSPRRDFVLNRAEYSGASILVTGDNFGCGSSREHAAWALEDYGFRAILAPSFADIFLENATQNGIAAITLPRAVIDDLIAHCMNHAPCALTVDLETRSIAQDDRIVAEFDMDDFRRTALMQGLDRIGSTLQYEADIVAHERSRLLRLG